MSSNWIYFTSQNVYDILLKLNFPHEMALRIKNEMPNGLADFIRRCSMQSLSSNANFFHLSAILSLLKHVSSTGFAHNSINFDLAKLVNGSFSDVNQIKECKEFLESPENVQFRSTEIKPVKYKTKKPVKRINKKQAVQIKEEKEEPIRVVARREKSPDPDYIPSILKSSSSESSLASLSNSPVKPVCQPLGILKDSTNFMSQQASNANSVVSQKVKQIQNLIQDSQAKQINCENKVQSQFRFLVDDLAMPLPRFSWRVQEALNNKSECLSFLPEISREAVEYYVENNYMLTTVDYMRIAQALLNRYPILHYSTLMQVEQDYIRLKTKQRSKPWTLISRQLAIELRNLRASNSRKQVEMLQASASSSD